MFHEAHAAVSASTSTTVSRARTAASSPIATAYSRSAPSNRPASSCSARSVARTHVIARSTLPSATRPACVCDGITQASTSNCATPDTRSARSAGRQLTYPNRTGSFGPNPRAVRRNASACSSNARVCGSNVSPNAVSVTVRRSRSNNRTPRSRSSDLICCDNDGPAMRKRVAARPKFSSSATATKYRNCRSSTGHSVVGRTSQLGANRSWKSTDGSTIIELDHLEKARTMNSQKVAVITGASQGIGAGLVTAYRKLGYAVVANSRTITRSDDPWVLAAPGDIAEPGVGARVIEQGLEAFGRIDTLVNNAGIFVAKPFTEYTDEDFDQVAGINLRGFFDTTRRAITAMLEPEDARHVVNITTSFAEHAFSTVPAALAALTKGGLNSVTKSLATEYATRGIRFNAVSPGVIRTPMHPEETHEFLAALHPLGRLGEIDEIVDAVTYLESAKFVTGEVLHVDGGQQAGH